MQTPTRLGCPLVTWLPETHYKTKFKQGRWLSDWMTRCVLLPWNIWYFPSLWLVYERNSLWSWVTTNGKLIAQTPNCVPRAWSSDFTESNLCTTSMTCMMGHWDDSISRMRVEFFGPAGETPQTRAELSISQRTRTDSTASWKEHWWNARLTKWPCY